MYQHNWPAETPRLQDKTIYSFNCLARHKMFQCTSKFWCQHCKCKHHTSLLPITTPASVGSFLIPVTNNNLSISPTCLLKTAVASVVNGCIRIFFLKKESSAHLCLFDWLLNHCTSQTYHNYTSSLVLVWSRITNLSNSRCCSRDSIGFSAIS